MPLLKAGVSSLSKSGAAKIINDVTLSQGTNITLTQSGQDISIAAAGATATPTIIVSTTFETAGRFNPAVLNGTNTFGLSGLIQDTTATIGSYASEDWFINGRGSDIYGGSPIVSIYYILNGVGTDLQVYGGLGQPTIAGTGFTFTVKHAGFKIIRAASGSVELFATQANGTTETASAALTTLVNDDNLDLIIKVNSTTSVDYYWRKNGGTLSSATNLATNMPADIPGALRFGVNNVNVATATGSRWGGSHYER